MRKAVLAEFKGRTLQPVTDILNIVLLVEDRCHSHVFGVTRVISIVVPIRQEPVKYHIVRESLIVGPTQKAYGKESLRLLKSEILNGHLSTVVILLPRAGHWILSDQGVGRLKRSC